MDDDAVGPVVTGGNNTGSTRAFFVTREESTFFRLFVWTSAGQASAISSEALTEAIRVIFPVVDCWSISPAYVH